MLRARARRQVFIGLYRALTNAASDGLLTDGFFWIPSLGGPSTMAENTSGRGLGWLFPLVDGAPPVGWHDALAYLALPALLVVSQFASQKIMQPATANADPSAASANAILKFLPFMVGWFSLNVPSGLTLYWLVNNVLTTAQTVYLRNSVAAPLPAGAGAGGAVARGGGLPPNPPPLTPASRAVVDVEAMAVNGSGRGNAVAAGGGGAASPGARFAQLKAAEKGKVKAPQRQATGQAPKVTWAAPDKPGSPPPPPPPPQS
jgi:YidC/Oxa1 family membrane protein insertase